MTMRFRWGMPALLAVLLLPQVAEARDAPPAEGEVNTAMARSADYRGTKVTRIRGCFPAVSEDGVSDPRYEDWYCAAEGAPQPSDAPFLEFAIRRKRGPRGFEMLVGERPSGHHHALDLRVDIAGRARIVVLAFSEQGRPFGDEEARLIQGLEALLANRPETVADERWVARSPQGHLVVDGDACTIRFLDAAGAGMLSQCSLVGQGVRLAGMPGVAPNFIADLCRAARRTGLPASGTALVPAGRLAVSVQEMQAPEMRAPAERGSGAFIVTLEQQVPLSRAALDMVMETRLSPTQKHLVVAAARGQRRSAAAAELGVGPEALKKHLAAVYSTLDLHGWEDIADRVRRHAAL